MAHDASRKPEPPKKTRAEREEELRRDYRALRPTPEEEIEGIVQMEIAKEIEEGKIADADE
jgi:hypothetical protein